MADKVYLVDGSGFIFRAFFAIAPLNTSSGFPTNALFGFTRMLVKLLGQLGAEHVVVVFDAGRETFRNKLYPEYKANRPECPPELLKQMPHFRDISKAMGLKILEEAGYEADDVIGTLARKLEAGGAEVIIISGDKDLMQLVSERVVLWDPLKDKYYRAPEVTEKFGVPPEQVIEILGLMGDSSDNVPGISGVGQKTAADLVVKYGAIESIIKSVELIAEDKNIRNRKKVAEAIRNETEILRLSRKLVEIDTNAPVHLNGGAQIQKIDYREAYEALHRVDPDPDALKKLAEQFEFQSILKNFGASQSAQTLPSNSQLRTIYKADLPTFLIALSTAKEMALDLETTSLDVREAAVVGVALAFNSSEAYYIPVGHQAVARSEDQVGWDELKEKLRAFLANQAIPKCGQNLKYDLGVLNEQGISVAGVTFDSMLAAYLINPDRGGYSLDVLVSEFLGRTVVEYDEIVGELPDFSFVPIDGATQYAAADALNAFALKEKLLPLLQRDGVMNVFSEIEMPLLPILMKMEAKGIKLDVQFLARMSEEFAAEMARLSKQIFSLVGYEFNLNSPKQLAEVLFAKLLLPTKGLKKTKTGISTDSSVLEKLEPLHPVPKLLLRYRVIHKLKSTYIDALPAQVSSKTGRLHTRFNQTGTGTGRLSSSDPNLQNIPIQTDEGRAIRKAFIAEPGNVLISADYSQIELRILAHMSGDEALCEAFRTGQDIHSKTAREIMGLGSNEVLSPELRRMGKTINFGIIYGMGPYRLARDLGIPVPEASRYIDDYFAKFSGVRDLFARLEREAEIQGSVQTLFGRRRKLADLDISGRDEGFSRRVALNAPIQGTAADLVKLAMIRIDKRFAQEKAPVTMILQIHDELVFECVGNFSEQGVRMIREEMEQVASLKVPLKVDVGVGVNWDEAH